MWYFTATFMESLKMMLTHWETFFLVSVKQNKTNRTNFRGFMLTLESEPLKKSYIIVI